MTQTEIVQAVISAFEKKDFSEVRDFFSQDFIMDWPGFLMVEDLDDLELFLKKNAPKRVVETKNHHFLEKDNIVFGNGEITVELHSGLLVKNYFCDIYEFQNGKIKKITSYILHDK